MRTVNRLNLWGEVLALAAVGLALSVALCGCRIPLPNNVVDFNLRVLPLTPVEVLRTDDGGGTAPGQNGNKSGGQAGQDENQK